MKNKLPWFKFYPADYIGSERTVLMTLEEEGAYIRLLSYCWIHGSIPADPIQIAALIGKNCTPALAVSVAQAFQVDARNEDRMVHARLNSERKQSEDRSKERGASGKRGASARWGKRKPDGSAINQPSNSHGSGNGSVKKEPLAKNGDSDPDKDADTEDTLHTAPPSGGAAGTEVKPPATEPPPPPPPPPQPPPEKPKIARERNLHLDTLVSADGSDLSQVTRSAWSAASKALKDIREVSPDVTPEEIATRTANYRKQFPNAAISPSALAKHWARLATARPVSGVLAPSTTSIPKNCR
jgi:uncharacterized protein YdaU (DUF1376 family)